MIEQALAKLLEEVVRRVVREELAARNDGDQYLSTESAARLVDVEPETIRDWIAEGLLTRYHAGRRVRVKRSELEQLLAKGRESEERKTPEDLAARTFRKLRTAG